MMSILSKIKFKAKHPTHPFIYAVTAGKFLGELLVYAEQESTNFIFLSLPTMKVRHIPIEKFEAGLNDKIVEAVEKLPEYVHRTCMQQYKKNKTTIALEVDTD